MTASHGSASHGDCARIHPTCVEATKKIPKATVETTAAIVARRTTDSADASIASTIETNLGIGGPTGKPRRRTSMRARRFEMTAASIRATGCPVPFERDGHRRLSHPQLLHRGAHRPREVDAGRPDARAHAHRRHAGDARAVPRSDGPRTRARYHDQGPGRPAVPRGLRAQPDRHPGTRGFHLRGLPVPRRL